MAKKFTYDEVKKIFSDSGCELLSEEYINSQTKLNYRCLCGEIKQIRLSSFRNGTRCMQCGTNSAKDKIKLSFEFVKQEFFNSGCELLESTYQNSRTRMRYRCDCGNVSHTTWDSFKVGKRCEKCAKLKRANKKRIPFEEVKRNFANAGCVLLETEYINNRVPMRYICSCGSESVISYSNFYNKGRRCYDCGVKARSGKNGCNYNPNLTDEERLDQRKYSGYYRWRGDVYKRDNYTCKACDTKGGYLIAHHLDAYHWAKEKRTDINNGVTLCRGCHNNFHFNYGRINNTREQYEEWISNKRNQDAI